MTCKDCIHYDVCVIVENSTNKDEDYYTEYGCNDFKNKADCMEVVRCKNCKYCESYICGFVGEKLLSCSYLPEAYAVEQNHFCGYGERRKDNG
jgi:hypothetical protein